MQEMKIQVLGSGCSTCKTLYKSVEEIAKKINPDLEVEYSTDITKIVELGAMSSPVFVVNGEVISVGKVPSTDEIKDAILGKLNIELRDKNESEGCSGCSCGGKC